MARVSIRVVPNERNIGGLTRTSRGMVTRYTRRLTEEAKIEATVITAAGTTKYGKGNLARSYRVTYGGTNSFSCTILMKNRRPYAAYVFRGTTGPIKSRTGKVMPVGKSQTGLGAARSKRKGRFTFSRSVDGQPGNNYPMRAITSVFRRHGIR